MTTTTVKTKNSFASMKALTAMESISFKIVNILFIALLNVSLLSAQVKAKKESALPLDYNVKPSPKQLKFLLLNPSLYTCLNAKTFPIIYDEEKEYLKNLNNCDITETEFVTVATEAYWDKKLQAKNITTIISKN